MTNEQINDYSKQSKMSSEKVKAHLDSFKEGGSYIVTQDVYDQFVADKEMLGYGDNSMFILPKSIMDEVIDESKGDIAYVEEALGFPEGYFDDGAVYRIDINKPMEHELRMATGTEMGANIYWATPLKADGELPKVLEKKPSEADLRHYPSEGKRPDKTVPMVYPVKTYKNDIKAIHGEYVDEKYKYHAPQIKGYDGRTSGGLPEAVVNQVPNTREYVTQKVYEGWKRGEHSIICQREVDGYYKPIDRSKIYGKSLNDKIIDATAKSRREMIEKTDRGEKIHTKSVNTKEEYEIG